jgi:hypothetical protein
MRVRESLIIEESILKKIDEIAGEKLRRAATIERALTEFIAREERKARTKPAVVAAATKGKGKSIVIAKR